MGHHTREQIQSPPDCKRHTCRRDVAAGTYFSHVVSRRIRGADLVGSQAQHGTQRVLPPATRGPAHPVVSWGQSGLCPCGRDARSSVAHTESAKERGVTPMSRRCPEPGRALGDSISGGVS